MNTTDEELWQLYDPQGNVLSGKGATKAEVFSKGLLHGATHVWIYRQDSEHNIEILLQKRAATKQTWPNLYDISAAGHIDLGEDPLEAGIRETREEISYEPKAEELRFLGIQRQYSIAPSGAIENEYNWLYVLELHDQVEFSFGDGEVDSLEWKPIDVMKKEVLDPHPQQAYVSHGDAYFLALFDMIERIDRVSR